MPLKFVRRLYLRHRKKYLRKVEEAFCIQQVLKPGMVAVDVGAHDGYHSVLMASLVGKQGKVLSFEPFPKSYQVLIDRVAEYGFANIVQPIKKALSDQTGETTLYMHRYTPGSNSLHRSAYHDKGMPIQTTSLDDVLSNRNHRVDYVKIDVEGHEYNVLLGMKKCLEANSDLAMILEFCPTHIKRAGHSAEEVLTFLSDHKFHIYRINRLSRTLDDVSHEELLGLGGRYYNLLCTRKLLPAAAVNTVHQ